MNNRIDFIDSWTDEIGTRYISIEWMGCYIGQMSKARGRDWITAAMEVDKISDRNWGANLNAAKTAVRHQLKG